MWGFVFGFFFSDEEPSNEIPQSDGYQYDQWFEPVPSQGVRSQEDMSLRSPVPAPVIASPLPSIGRDLQPPVLGQGTLAPLGGDFAEPPPQPVPPAGKCCSLVSLQKSQNPTMVCVGKGR